MRTETHPPAGGRGRGWGPRTIGAGTARAFEAAAALCDAYGALFLARDKRVGGLVMAATWVDPAAGACGLAAGLAALGGRAALGLPPLGGQTELLNGVYAGLALAAFHAFDGRLLAVAVLAGLVAPPLATALQHVLSGPSGNRGLPTMGAPFLCLAWLSLAACRTLGVPLRVVYPAWPAWVPEGAAAVLARCGSLFYVSHPIAGLLVLAALMRASRALTLLALAGGAVATGFLAAGGVPTSTPLATLAAYDGALVAMYLGGALVEPSRRALAVAFAGAIVATIFSAALITVLWPLGLPPLSAPFLLTVWLARAALRPEASDAWARHWLLVPGCPEQSLTTRKLARIRGLDPDSLALRPPFAGRMEVAQGFAGTHTHQGAWRHALDFVRTANGLSYRHEGRALEDFFSFDSPVLSPVYGQVVAANDGVPDNPPGVPNLRENWGNWVMIGVDGVRCVVLAHLRKDSVSVAPGQWIVPGTPIGHCGNSGRSSQPHLHLHAQRGTWLGAPTCRFHMAGCLVEDAFVLDCVPVEGAAVEPCTANAEFAAGLDPHPGRTWSFETERGLWHLEVVTTVLGERMLRSSEGAQVRVHFDGQLFALHGRDGGPDPVLDAFVLAFGLTPHAERAKSWRDGEPATLLPLSPGQRLRSRLRRPWAAIVDGRYVRSWDSTRACWVQHGEHAVTAIPRPIRVETMGLLREGQGPIAFSLTVGGRRRVEARLARFGNCGDHGVPPWSEAFSSVPLPGSDASEHRGEPVPCASA